MNYYNPYFSYPYMNSITRTPGLFSRLFRGINFSSILNGTQKTLNIVNQTIPLIKQVQPIFKNAKTMFKVMNEFKKVDSPNVNTKNDNSENYKVKSNGPTFFA